MVTGQPQKEVTILDLVKDTGKLLDDLQGRLDGRFARHPSVGEGKSDRPENPNVLDEILDEAKCNYEHLNRIISFISSEVLPKIN